MCNGKLLVPPPLTEIQTSTFTQPHGCFQALILIVIIISLFSSFVLSVAPSGPLVSSSPPFRLFFLTQADVSPTGLGLAWSSRIFGGLGNDSIEMRACVSACRLSYHEANHQR